MRNPDGSEMVKSDDGVYFDWEGTPIVKSPTTFSTERLVELARNSKWHRGYARHYGSGDSKLLKAIEERGALPLVLA